MPSPLLQIQINKFARTLDLPSFFHYKHIASLINHPLLAQGEGLPFWFGVTFSAVLVLIYPVERTSFVCNP